MTGRRKRRLLGGICTSWNRSSPRSRRSSTSEEGHDDPARLERTLTDGYAQALTLEAERTSLERRVLRLSLELDENGEATLREVQALARSSTTATTRSSGCEASSSG